MASPQANAAIQYTTKCRVPGCGQELQSPPLVPIVGGKPNQDVIDFVLRLYKHLEKKHPEQFNQLNASVQQWMGFSAIALFHIQDPVLVMIQESVRAAIHRFTTKSYITDLEIQDRVAALGFTENEAEGLNTLLRDMRDILCEEGAYAPGPPVQKSIVTP